MDVQLSPLSFGIFKSICCYGDIVSILVLSTRSVRQKWRHTMLRATDSRKRCSRSWTISTHAILSHTMTGNKQKVVERVWQNYRLSKESARSESSVIVCERIAQVEIVQAREQHLLRESVGRNMARFHSSI